MAGSGWANSCVTGGAGAPAVELGEGQRVVEIPESVCSLREEQRAVGIKRLLAAVLVTEVGLARITIGYIGGAVDASVE